MAFSNVKMHFETEGFGISNLRLCILSLELYIFDDKLEGFFYLQTFQDLFATFYRRVKEKE